MPSKTRESLGLLATAVSIRERDTGSIESLIHGSVLDAAQHAIYALAGRTDLTAVVVVGEDESVLELEYGLTRRSAALARAVDQAGLFLTLAAQDIVRDRLEDDVRFEDFGIFDVEEAGRAERLFALFHPDLPEPLQPQRKVAGNCRALTKSFVGRHRERDELQDLMLYRRMVTITGFPGVGKTTTAIHVARSLDEDYQDGIWLFSVEDQPSMDSLLQAIATSRGLLSLKGPLTLDRVADGLASKRGVVILDGCESMAGEIGEFCSILLSGTSTLSIILTSTCPIGIDGEYVYRLEPMSLPRTSEAGEDALNSSDALALFFERSTQAGGRLALDEGSVELATEICMLVDGLPLAIELVASSMRTSSLAKVFADLTKQPSGASAPRGLSLQLDSLKHALALSYETLRRDHRDLLQRLAMFRGEWNVDVAAQIWSDEFSLESLAKLHQELVDGSWIAFDANRDTYRMLHTMRSFCEAGAQQERPTAVSTDFGHAVVQLPGGSAAGSSEANPLVSRFCERVVPFAAKICAELQGANALDAEGLLSRHYSDFSFALEFSIGDPALASCASGLMGSMVFFWLQRHLLDDAERLTQSFLDSGIVGIDLARAYVMQGVVYLRRRKLVQAEIALRRCLELSRQLHDEVAEASALSNLGITCTDAEKHVEAIGYHDEAVAIYRRLGRPQGLCAMLSNSADAYIKAARAGSRDDRQELLENAEWRLAEAEALASNLDPWKLQSLTYNVGALALCRGQFDQAEVHFLRAVAICAKHAIRHEATEAVEGLAEISLARGLGPSAAKLVGLAGRLRQESGKTRTDYDTEHFGLLVSRVSEVVDRADRLMSYGERLELDELLSPSVFNL